MGWHLVTDLDPQRVLVAGAASGIGRAVALQQLTVGADVAALDRDADGLGRLSDEAGRLPGGLRTYCADAGDPAALRATAESAVHDCGGFDALVNTVGINPDAGTPVVDVDIAVFDRVVAVNLRSALVLSQVVLPGMAARGYGRVVHVSSIAGKEGNPRMASYSATKAGLIGLTKSIAREYAGTGVVVNSLAPAVIRTPLLDSTPDDVVEGMLARIPMGRAGELTEVAALVAWMISPACSFTTGFTFDLSGGRATY